MLQFPGLHVSDSRGWQPNSCLPQEFSAHSAGWWLREKYIWLASGWCLIQICYKRKILLSDDCQTNMTFTCIKHAQRDYAWAPTVQPATFMYGLLAWRKENAYGLRPGITSFLVATVCVVLCSCYLWVDELAYIRSASGLVVQQSENTSGILLICTRGLVWALWKSRSKLTIEKKFSTNPADVIHFGVVFVQRWSPVLKESD